MESILLHPIGYIQSPYYDVSEMPGSNQLDTKVTASLTLLEQYKKGLMDLDGFSHAIILFYFHRSTKENITAVPPFDAQKHGVFSTRSPHRPNHIGMSTVPIQKIQGATLYFTQVDMIDGTPVIDIKPYTPLSCKPGTLRFGWLEKHIKNQK
jgi:tRNA-Thr(GGU) m(6)t(6)A37 methyltransferase TsaA